MSILLSAIFTAFTAAALLFIQRLLKTKSADSLENETEDEIIPLRNFDFREVELTKPLPFLSMGHVTMGIQKAKRSEWLEIDKQYLNRILHRSHLMRKNPETTIGNNEAARDAIQELFEQVVLDYLPKRFPTIFQLNKSGLHNSITQKCYAVHTPDFNTFDMLKCLGENVEEDFYLMVPDDQDAYRLQGYVACFPGGFLSPEKVGMSVRELHIPVPGYVERIGKSVDKYFSQMEDEKFIRRWNWSLQTDGSELFKTEGNNFYPEQGQELLETYEAIDLATVYLRVERQTLCRLPRSRAIVFCVRSYMTPITEVVQDGNGIALASAIESMPDKLGVYKKRPYWADSVLDFLRTCCIPDC